MIGFELLAKQKNCINVRINNSHFPCWPPLFCLAQDPMFVILNCFRLPIGNDQSGWIHEEEWAIIGFWDQFWHENMHSYFFSLNLVILEPRIYSQLRYLQSLGNQFGKKTKLRMWCTFFCQNHEK